MVIVAKMVSGQLVQVVKIAEIVEFSAEPGWIMICIDWEQKERKKQHFRWIPSSTRFEWVKEFISVDV